MSEHQVQKELTENEWKTIRSIAQQLAMKECDPNEVAKLLSYLRAKSDLVAFHNVLKVRETMLAQKAENAPFVRSDQTSQYWSAIGKVLQDHAQWLPENPERLLLLLGWAARLMRYYNTKVGREEIAERQRTRESPQPPPRRRSSSVRMEVPEMVTLVGSSSRGMARVRTEQGEEVPCTKVSNLLQVGRVFLAAVTREDGRAVSAVFKGLK
jgi:hypothetical protein